MRSDGCAFLNPKPLDDRLRRKEKNRDVMFKMRDCRKACRGAQWAQNGLVRSN